MTGIGYHKQIKLANLSVPANRRKVQMLRHQNGEFQEMLHRLRMISASLLSRITCSRGNYTEIRPVVLFKEDLILISIECVRIFGQIKNARGDI